MIDDDDDVEMKAAAPVAPPAKASAKACTKACRSPFYSTRRCQSSLLRSIVRLYNESCLAVHRLRTHEFAIVAGGHASLCEKDSAIDRKQAPEEGCGRNVFMRAWAFFFRAGSSPLAPGLLRPSALFRRRLQRAVGRRSATMTTLSFLLVRTRRRTRAEMTTLRKRPLPRSPGAQTAAPGLGLGQQSRASSPACGRSSHAPQHALMQRQARSQDEPSQAKTVRACLCFWAWLSVAPVRCPVRPVATEHAAPPALAQRLNGREEGRQGQASCRHVARAASFHPPSRHPRQCERARHRPCGAT